MKRAKGIVPPKEQVQAAHRGDCLGVASDPEAFDELLARRRRRIGEICDELQRLGVPPEALGPVRAHEALVVAAAPEASRQCMFGVDTGIVPLGVGEVRRLSVTVTRAMFLERFIMSVKVARQLAQVVAIVNGRVTKTLRIPDGIEGGPTETLMFWWERRPLVDKGEQVEFVITAATPPLEERASMSGRAVMTCLGEALEDETLGDDMWVCCECGHTGEGETPARCPECDSVKTL